MCFIGNNDGYIWLAHYILQKAYFNNDTTKKVMKYK